MSVAAELTLSRIIIFGHRLDKLKSFYVDHFNFSVTQDFSDYWIVLQGKSIEIALHRIGPEYEPKPGETFRAESNTKLVFQISDNLDTFRKRLIDHGISMGAIKSIEGIDSLFCDGEDPEGNVFQLEQRILPVG